MTDHSQGSDGAGQSAAPLPYRESTRTDAAETAAGVYPATPAQYAVWYAVRSGQVPSIAYNLVWRLHLDGPLDVASAERALSTLIDRHEPLRTTFHLGPDGLLQIVQPAWFVHLEATDLSTLERAGSPVRLDRLIGDVGAEAFDVDTGPLIRFALLRLADFRHVLVVVMHHLIADGASWPCFVREFADCYAGRMLPALPCRYGEFAVWQREQLESGEWSASGAEWEERLAHGSETCSRLAMRLASTDVSNSHAVFVETIPSRLARAVESAAAEYGVTPFRLLLSAFLLCVARCTGQADVGVRTTVAGRSRSDVESAVGFFANAVPVHATARPDASLKEFVREVHAEVAGAIRRGAVPGDALAGRRSAESGLQSCPLGIGFTKQPSPVQLSIAGLSISEERIYLPASPYALAVYVQRAEGVVDVTYLAHDAFADRVAIRGFHSAYLALLEAVVTAPERSVETVIEGAGVSASIVAGPVHRLPPGATLHGLVEAQSAREPTRRACVQGAVDVTYGELDRAADQIAARLGRLGVRPGDLVGLCVERSPEGLAALLGILKAGAAYVALDPGFPAARRALIAGDAALTAIVAHSRFVEEFDRTFAVLPLSRASLEPVPFVPLPRPPEAPRLAYAAYTSGSTGRPKGVLGTHAGAVNYLGYLADTYGLGPSDIVLQLASWSFDASVRDLIGPLAAGAVVVLPDEQEAADPMLLLRLARAHGVTRLLSTVPSVLSSLVDAAPGAPASFWAPRTILVSGDRLPGALSQRARDVFGPAMEIVNQYGPTETTMTTTYWRVPADSSRRPNALAGLPLQNTRIYVLDERLQPVPEGLAGEVYIGGVGVSPGYVGRADLTAERFVPDPFSGGEPWRMYRTGDRGRIVDDGALEFLGRLDRQLKIRGVRVEPAEVEHALRALPGVADAVVTVSRRAEEATLVAYVVPAAGFALDTRGVIADLGRRLPAPFVPQSIFLLDAVPRTRNGKVDHQQLPDVPTGRLEPPPAPADHTSIEAKIAVIWEELLHLDRVGADESFFDLGGHSLLAAAMLGRVNQAFGTELPLAAFSAEPTVAALAALAGSGDAGRRWQLLVPLQPRGTKLPLFLLHGIGGQIDQFRTLASLVGPDRPVYGLIGHVLAGEPIPASRMEGIAAAFVPIIRACQPVGPYHLAGHSFGGLLAFELARQLRRAGHEVGLVGLIDSKGRGYPAYPSLLARMAATCRGHADAMGGFTLRHLRRYGATRARLAGRKVRQWTWRIAHGAAIRTGVDLPSAVDRIPDRPYYPVLAAYRPGRYDGRVALFRASIQPKGCIPDRYCGWGPYARDVDVYDAPGDHLTIVADLNAGSLARQIAHALERCETGRPETG